MASSWTSSLSSIHCGPLEPDVLWMQDMRVSHQHIWNMRMIVFCKWDEHMSNSQWHFGSSKRNCTVPRWSSFRWVAEMRFIKISVGLICALVEGWRLQTHTFLIVYNYFIKKLNSTINLYVTSVTST